MTRGAWFSAMVLLLPLAELRGQIFPLPSDNTVALGGVNLQVAVAPAGQTITYVNVMVDRVSGGTDL